MSTLAEHSTDIDGVRYTTQTYPATEGLELMRRLAAMLDSNMVGQALMLADDEPAEGETPADGESAEGETPAEGEPGKAAAPTVKDIMANTELLLTFLIGAAQQSKPGEWGKLVKDLLKYCVADKVKVGQAIVPAKVLDKFDSHFAGRYMHLFKVCVWCARVGFAEP